MPRFARLVVPGITHHAIQRGNRRQKVFFCEADKEFYLKLLRRTYDRAGLSFLAYCLMDNHVHLVIIPQRADSLARGLGETHRIYTSVINAREDWNGYLWQGRFLSFPMDEAYLYMALRYVENNPVRAGLVRKAEEFRWSSAAFHCFGGRDPLVKELALDVGVGDWSSYLNQEIPDHELREIRKYSSTGRPLGNEAFLKRLEQITGRVLKKRKPGKKKAIKSAVS